MGLIITSALVLGSMGLIFGVGLAIAGRKFEVEIDPRLAEILSALPGSNCGACGYSGCESCAQAILEGKAPVTACVAGGEKTAQNVAQILDVKNIRTVVKNVAFLTCQGAKGIAQDKFIYYGLETCKIANLIQGGYKACPTGCLIFGDCVEACVFDAIHIGSDGLPKIDMEKCTGCGLCVKACPRGVLSLFSVDIPLLLGCKSALPGPDARKVCDRACIACGICEKACPTGAIKMDGRFPVIDYSLCNSCGICVEKCPTKSLILLKQ